MTARVLVVDDIATNVKLMQARLLAAYFEVMSASNGPEALEICRAGLCDIVLLDVMMPGMDGYEVCRQLKADPHTAHLPVVMITALDQPSDKIRGLEAGADDFLSKPVSDVALSTRVKSLARLKMATDELHLRLATGESLGLGDISPELLDPKMGRDGRVLVVDDDEASWANLHSVLVREHGVEVVTDSREALFRLSEETFDLVVVPLATLSFDALRFCSQMRSLDRLRVTPILVTATPGEERTLMQAIDIGANDYVMRPIDPSELLARARTQVKRKRLNDKLRESLNATMEMAVKDALTGLSNRRYLDRHIGNIMARAQTAQKPVSVIVLDIDHFKLVNDTYGHAAGDDVLRVFAQRLSRNVRAKDLACRFGGEEFVVVMPDTDQALAAVVADRMRREVANEPFSVDAGARSIGVTVSAGVASLMGPEDDMDAMLKRADAALYQAKRSGRNQVMVEAA